VRRSTGLALALLMVATAGAEAKPRPGAPKAKVVQRAISGVIEATPFASGRRAARRAKRAFARKRHCAASSALARHNTLALRRRGGARLAGRSARARGLVLRSRPRGKACGGKPAVGVDRSLRPREQLPALDGSGARPVARLTDAYGNAVDFAANELIFSGTDAQARALVTRWKGEILQTADLTQIGMKHKQFLIRIRTARADEARLASDLAALTKARGGTLTASSGQGLELLAAAGREARRGADVGVNYLGEGAALGSGSTIEDPRGPSGFSMTGPGWTPNAFDWSHLSDTSAQSVGTAAAWQLLQRSGRAANKVGLAVLDMGFSPVVNGPDFGTPLRAISNVPFHDALEEPNIGSCGTPCPWHGTGVANTAFAVPDDNRGVAGTGGLVADRIVVYTYYDFFTSINAILAARVAGARVINMSYGAKVPVYVAFTVYPFEAATVGVRASGAILLAAAGNDNQNVDAEDCFLACWEEAWWTPCENAGVYCVGGLAHDAVTRADYSNYGNSGGGVDLFAPGTVLIGPDPSYNGAPGTTPVRRVQGTSFASPYLAGVAALVRAADPALSASRVEQILTRTARQSSDQRVRRYVDAAAAVRDALPRLINIEQPADGSAIDKGTPITFGAFVYEDGRGAPTSITWTRGGSVIGSGATFSTSALGYGVHDVQVRATFASGEAVTDQVRVTVANTAPTVALEQPAGAETYYQNEDLPLRATSGDINQPESGRRLRDEQVGWYLDTLANQVATGHEATLDLAGVPVGDHTLIVAGTDDAGARTTDQIALEVAPASANPPPVVSITSPADDAAQPTCCQDPPGQYYTEFTFTADVSDPNGDALTYTWTETPQPGGGPTVRSTVEDPGPQRVYFTSCSSQGNDWTLSVSDGNTTRTDTVRVFISDVVC
jgi:serine protease